MKKVIIKLLAAVGLYDHTPRWLPDTVYQDDIYIVAYPKSGSTWLRFMLASYLDGQMCDFTDYYLIVPDIHYDPALCENIERPRFIKSHAPYTSEYPNVVYLVRDGRDIAVSYYYHSIKYKHIDSDTPFDEFLETFNEGGIRPWGTWNDHVLSWLDNPPDNFLLISYESMKKNPQEVLKRILRFAGLPLKEELIKLALEAADFQRMQALEIKQQDYGAGLAGSDPSIRFVRSGKIGEAEQHFNKQLLADFVAAHGQALKRLDYI